MTRFTKTLAAVAVVGAVGFGTQTASAQQFQPQVVTGYGANWHQPPGWRYPPVPLPRPVPPPIRIDYDYVVYVQQPFRGWTYYGRYNTIQQARQVEWRLERAGHRAKIETLVDYPGPRRPW